MDCLRCGQIVVKNGFDRNIQPKKRADCSVCFVVYYVLFVKAKTGKPQCLSQNSAKNNSSRYTNVSGAIVVRWKYAHANAQRLSRLRSAQRVTEVLSTLSLKTPHCGVFPCGLR